MKHAIILTDNITQIVLTAETESEKQIIDILSKSTGHDLQIEYHEGTLYDDHNVPPSAWHYQIEKCRGGYLRAFGDPRSLMIVIEKKSKAKVET